MKDYFRFYLAPLVAITALTGGVSPQTTTEVRAAFHPESGWTTGPASEVRIRPLSAPSPGHDWSLEIEMEPGASSMVLVGIGGPRPVAGSPLGELLVHDPVHLVRGGRRHAIPIPHEQSLVGVRLTVQALIEGPNSVVLSRPTTMMVSSGLDERERLREALYIGASMSQATIDEAGTLTVSASDQARFEPVTCWNNYDWSGFVDGSIAPFGTEEYVYSAVQAVSAQSPCADLGRVVSEFTLAYGTTAIAMNSGGPGASLTLRFYDAYIVNTDTPPYCPVAEFTFSGLPGSPDGSVAAHALTVELPPGSRFALPDRSGRFSYGFSGNDQSASIPGIAATVPALSWAGDGLGGPDALGMVDTWSTYNPDAKGVFSGNSSYMGPPNDFSSCYLTLGFEPAKADKVRFIQ